MVQPTFKQRIVKHVVKSTIKNIQSQETLLYLDMYINHDIDFILKIWLFFNQKKPINQ